jgi:SAM-dependent methyltransferase
VTALLLAGHRPPDLHRLRRVVHLGCGKGTTAAVVAACHPNTEVWAWAPRLDQLEATDRCAAQAGLANLVTADRLELPPDLGGGPADIVVIQDVLAKVDDDLREQIAAATARVLRPGGVLCVTYPTVVGWSEIAPVQALMHRLAQGHDEALGDLVPPILAALEQLRAGGARYLTERPVVAAWLDALGATDPAEVADQFLSSPFRPLSPAQVEALVAPAGCRFVGSSLLTDELTLEAAPALHAAASYPASRIVTETYRDLALRRSHRFDLYQSGAVPMPVPERDAAIAGLNLAGLAHAEEPPAVAVDREAWRQLTSYGVVARELHPDVREVDRIVRILMTAGQAHPVVDGPRQRAQEACEALNATIAGESLDDVRALALIGSAVGTNRATSVRGMAPRQAS